MDNQDAILPGADSPAPEQSGRRDFIKKMVMAGAFAAPVVATFARGARASSTLSAELADNAGAPAMNSFEAKLLNAGNQAKPTPSTVKPASPTTRAPIVTSNTTSPPRTKNAALPTNTTVKPATTTAKPASPTTRAPIVTSNVRVPRSKNATLSTTTTVKKRSTKSKG